MVFVNYFCDYSVMNLYVYVYVRYQSHISNPSSQSSTYTNTPEPPLYRYHFTPNITRCGNVESLLC